MALFDTVEESKKVAAPMLPISKILKSQEKLDDAKIEESL